jgi:hypothetical protein
VFGEKEIKAYFGHGKFTSFRSIASFTAEPSKGKESAKTAPAFVTRSRNDFA